MSTYRTYYAPLLVAAGLLLVPCIALAQDKAADAAQDAPTMIHACYVPTSGLIYRIKEPGLQQTCLAETHVEFTWAAGVLGGARIAGDGQVSQPERAVGVNAGDDGVLAAAIPISGFFANGDLTAAGIVESQAGGFKFPDGTVQTSAAGGDDVASLISDQTFVGTNTFADPDNSFTGTFTGDGSGLTNLPTGASTHGELTGLEADDHTQYLLAEGVRNTTNGFALARAATGGAVPVEGAGTRLMWYPGKQAFRAGGVDGTQWDDANVGHKSVAFGYNTTASGSNSAALGFQTTASGNNATALGFHTTASADFSTAMGGHTIASGLYATALGLQNTASGAYTTALGRFTTSHAYASLALGRFNVISGSPTTWIETDPLLVVGNGVGLSAPSNALTLYKNGNLTAAGMVESEAGGVKFPDGSIQTTAATGSTSWGDLTDVPEGFADGVDDVGPSDHGGLGGLADDDHTQYLLAEGVRTSTGFAAIGNTGGIPASGAGTRLMWYPGKAAFRAGAVDGTQWDEVYVGQYSVAMGYNATAGYASTAMGYNTTAVSSYSTAMGYNTIAGHGSTALGYNTTAAANLYATALGINTTASGTRSTAMGSGTTASGWYSTAMGSTTEASGRYSTAIGDNTTAQARASLVLGRFNVIGGSAVNWNSADPLFVIGNGTSVVSRNNAFVVLKNGNTTIDGDLTVTGSCSGCSSDRRLKQNVRPLDDALEKISQLKGVAYDWRGDVREAEVYPGPQIGVVAQEVEQVFPELVGTDSRGYKYVRYQKLVAPLIEAVKELKAQNEALERRLVALERTLANGATMIQGGSR